MICLRIETNDGTRSLKGIGSVLIRSISMQSDAFITDGSLSHSARRTLSLRCETDSGSIWWKRWSAMTAFLRTSSIWWPSSRTTSATSAGIMSFVTSFEIAESAPHASR